MTDVIRTLERGYFRGSMRGRRVTRMHVIRETGPFGRTDERYLQTWCGQTAGDVTNSQAIIRDAPHGLPDGLSWCPVCVGHLADHLGRTGELARLLGLETAS